MFCKICGSNIKEGTGFCPKCGCSIGKEAAFSGGGVSFGLESIVKQVDENTVSGKKTGIPFQRILTMACIVVVVAAVFSGIVMFAVRTYQNREFDEEIEEIEYSIVGDWISTDDCDLGDVLVALFEEEGMGAIADTAVYLLGLDESGKINLCFTESGKMYLGVDNLFPEIGEFTYEDHGSSIMMNFKMDLGGSIGAFGFELGVEPIPISISYKAKYRVDQDGLLLDLFGKKLRFVLEEF